MSEQSIQIQDAAFPSEYEFGLTIRDYFAAKAMQGIVAANASAVEDFNTLHVAMRAYQLADAMLKEREVRHDRR